MREAVRSGRRANFYITENSFIDHYAREVKPLGVAVYHVLERHANCDTRSTWIGTAKMADLLGYSQRQIQRTLKSLANLKLIRILETEDKTTYVVVPVPPRTKTGTTPLFDQISDTPSPEETIEHNESTPASLFATPVSREVTGMSHATTPVSRFTTRVSPSGDIRVALYKEEQDSSNKTPQQDVKGNKTLETSPASTIAQQTKHCTLRIVQLLGMPETEANIRIVEAALTAEIRYTGQSPEDAAQVIASAAANDRQKGVSINKFYFEDTKWRASNGGRNKAEQQFDRINRARERAIENIKARSHSQNLDH